MLEGSLEELTEIATDASTPSHLLMELGKHENSQIRSLVASNPNTPLNTLKSLGREFADAIVENPAFNLLKLKNPDSEFVQFITASSTKTPSEVLTQLIAIENLDGYILYAAVGNPNMPIDIITPLAISAVRHKNVDYPHTYRQATSGTNSQIGTWLFVVLNIISRPDFPESSLKKITDICIERNHKYLLFKIANLPNVSFSILEKLSRYPDKHPDKRIEGFEEFLIDFPIVKESPILLDNIARNIGNIDLRHKKDVFLKIVNNPLTLSSTIEYLAAYRYHSPQVRNALAYHPNVSRKALYILLLTQLKPGIPIEVLHEVAENPRFYSERLLCIYPNVPSEVINKISDNLPSYGRDAGYRLLVLQYLVYHPNSSLNLLQKILDELQQVSSSVTNGKKYYQGKFIDDKLLQNINELAEKISLRLKGKNLAETKQLSAYWSLFDANPSQVAKEITEKYEKKIRWI